jgi:hypothetical protein
LLPLLSVRKELHWPDHDPFLDPERKRPTLGSQTLPAVLPSQLVRHFGIDRQGSFPAAVIATDIIESHTNLILLARLLSGR